MSAAPEMLRPQRLVLQESHEYSLGLVAAGMPDHPLGQRPAAVPGEWIRRAEAVIMAPTEISLTWSGCFGKR